MAKRKGGARKAPRSSARRISTRAKVLAVLTREREVFNRQTQSYERRPPTMTQAAKQIGVSVRTLRRWKNEGVQPRLRTRRDIARFNKLTKAAQNSERSTKRELDRDAKKHKGALRITKKDLPVLPQAHRRLLKRYAKDKKGVVVPTGQEYDSSILNYNVRGWTFREIAALVLQAWHAKKPFQFIYEVPAGGQLPKSGRHGPRKVAKMTRAGTAPINPLDFDDESQVIQFLNRYIDFEQGMYSRRMIYVSVDDNMPQGREDDDE